MKEVIEKAEEVKKFVDHKAESHEEVIAILSIAHFITTRSASMSDIRKGYHLESEE